jgi:hypothetical protein
MKVRQRFAFFAFSLLFAIVAGIACRAYYAFVYLPGFHGGWSEAWSRLFDLEGWWTFATRPGGYNSQFGVDRPIVFGVPVLGLAERSN